MSDALRHRGPDAEGQWCDPTLGLALSHRRLSIVDLSPTGAQPMHSASARYVTVFNGEIYNFGELRELLRSGGAEFRGGSDTEVLLAACEAWGVPAAVRRCAGMFAIAIFDRETRQLWLARDRMGEKPLLYGNVGGRLVFGSELTAIEAVAKRGLTVSPAAVRDVMERGCVRGAHTIYTQVNRLPPGHIAVFDGSGSPPVVTPYWSVEESVGQIALDTHNDAHVVDSLETLLGAVVQEQMVADVPLGAFLSGGIDSSLITALMQRNSASRVRTFTIAFGERSHNEADHARLVATHLGTEHTEIPLPASAALELVPSLATIFDEPFADSSQLPAVLVSRVTRQHVTVALSGDGGDELFGGYAQYQTADTLGSWAHQFPAFLARPTSELLQRVPRALQMGFPAGEGRWTPNVLARLTTMLDGGNPATSYELLQAHWGAPHFALRNPAPRSEYHAWPAAPSAAESMMRYDMTNYLPDDILVKVDRSAMSASLETRAPLLDHRIVQFALSLPLQFKIRNGSGKWILKALLERHIPRAMFDRPKRGFSVPLDVWLRGPLAGWVAETLAPDATLLEWFHPEPLNTIWKQQRAGLNRARQLWPVLMLLGWLRSH